MALYVQNLNLLIMFWNFCSSYQSFKRFYASLFAFKFHYIPYPLHLVKTLAVLNQGLHAWLGKLDTAGKLWQLVNTSWKGGVKWGWVAMIMFCVELCQSIKSQKYWWHEHAILPIQFDLCVLFIFKHIIYFYYLIMFISNLFIFNIWTN